MYIALDTEKTLNLSRLQVKALLLSVITEIKFGQPLAANAKQFKAMFKEMVGLKKTATNNQLLAEFKRIYVDNHLEEEFNHILTKFKIEIK